MATDFGVDVDATVDVPLVWGLCSGFKNLGNALVRRLLFLRNFVNAGLTPDQISSLRSRVMTAVEADPRVQAVDSLVFNGPDVNGTLFVGLVIDTADGPFPLVLAVTSVTVDILNNGVPSAAAAVQASILATPVPGPAGARGGPGPDGGPGPAGPSGSGGGGSLLQYKDELSSSAGTEEVVDQMTVDFSKFAAGTLTLELAGRFLSAAGTATFKLYVGGNYGLADGTLVVTGTDASGGAFTVHGFSGTFTNPTGLRAVKLTITSSGAAVIAESKGATVSITS